MTPAPELRVGSLEILLALAAFYFIAARLPPSGVAVRPRIRLQLRVRQAAASAIGPRDAVITLGDGMPAALVGRSSEAAVGLLDPEVSRRHARFDFADGVVYLSDLGSSNGTFLNGKRIKGEGIEVRPGDDIDVGNTRLTVMEASAQPWT